MKVTVVIAVYNAEQFVATAIESALAQPETAEVNLVEDGSPDGSLAICELYAARDPKVNLVRHPNGENRGAGASFNLGILSATQPYVAILGADDQYVPNAFAHARDIFARHSDADGAYAHIGVKYYEPELRAKHLKRIPREISGMFEEIRPEALLCALLSGRKGHFSLDSLVMKRTILTAAYLFDETLCLGQDTDFIYRLSSAYRLYGPKETTIVALRGVHMGNRVWDFGKAAQYRRKLLLKCMQSNFYGCKKKDSVIPVINRYLRDGFISRVPLVPMRIKRRIAYLIFLWTHPAIHREIRKCS
jgi:glycosyltransferase involved in cell wall biosynthesis